jgi:hypothetical protein
VERICGDPEAYVRCHVRRLEALRRAGHAERIDADTSCLLNYARLVSLF